MAIRFVISSATAATRRGGWNSSAIAEFAAWFRHLGINHHVCLQNTPAMETRCPRNQVRLLHFVKLSILTTPKFLVVPSPFTR